MLQTLNNGKIEKLRLSLFCLDNESPIDYEILSQQISDGLWVGNLRLLALELKFRDQNQFYQFYDLFSQRAENFSQLQVLSFRIHLQESVQRIGDVTQCYQHIPQIEGLSSFSIEIINEDQSGQPGEADITRVEVEEILRIEAVAKLSYFWFKCPLRVKNTFELPSKSQAVSNRKHIIQFANLVIE